jgi:DNA polymerase I-like protein with 3'-5' exonuclease and polymerase domains
MYQRPLFEPESGWQMPDEFPDLTRERYVGIDFETRDPLLRSHGPGFVRGDAYAAGVAVSTLDRSWYFPMRHAEGPNLAPNVVSEWLADQLKNARSDAEWVGANTLYELETSWYLGAKHWNCIPRDIQIAEPLMDEEADDGYELGVLAKKYLGYGKDEALLNEAAFLYRQGKKFDKKKDFSKTNLWRYPAKFVGPYAEADAKDALLVYLKQKPLLEEQGLWPAFELESKIQRILLKMRVRGVPVDVARAERVYDELGIKLYGQPGELNGGLQGEIDRLAGIKVNPWSAEDLAKAFEARGYYYNRTKPTKGYPNGQPSFEGDWLKAQDHDLGKKVAQFRRIDKMRRDFVKSYILDKHVNGRMYPQFIQVATDSGGTKSFRFASKNPNHQNIPARDPVYGPLIRSIWIAEPGCRWTRADYSQQEPRLTLHYAELCGFPGAKEAGDLFRANPRTDYHAMTGDLGAKKLQKFAEMDPKVRRKKFKATNLGIAYGEGKRKLAQELGMELSDAEEFLDEYHDAIPYIRPLSNEAMKRAERVGMIKTLMSHVRHFNKWVPMDPELRNHSIPCSLEKAKKKWPGMRLVRANTHKALNALIQTSAAGQTKKAMVDLDSAGYNPEIQVHDELDDAKLQTDKEIREYKEIMENCVQLTVPIVAEIEVGPSWGELKDWVPSKTKGDSRRSL